MNTIEAMKETYRLAEERWPRRVVDREWPFPLTLPHLRHMMTDTLNRKMSAGKANRWLGWMQAAIVSWGVATLEEMKAINEKHRGDDPLETHTMEEGHG